MKQTRLFLSCFLLQSFFGPALNAQHSLTPGQLRMLDSIATQDVPPGAPGIATAIVASGRVVYQKTAGYASLPDSALITAGSRFNIASNAKQFTALAILVLQSQGKLALSDDIRKYLPGLFTSIKQKISILHLLTHTSGIRDVYDLWSLQGITWWKNTFANHDALNLLAKQRDLNFAPGRDYLYSNSNYILLAQIIEKVTGQAFARYMNGLFLKLGMRDTSFEPDHTSIRGPVARAYFNFDSWTTYNWIWNVCGDGNLFTTLNDQVQWEKLVQGQGSAAIDTRVIKKSQALANPAINKKYGYGLEFGQYKGLDYVFHEGATGAWKATAIRFPSQKLSFITLTNTGKSIPASQTRQMADVVLNLPGDKAFFATRPPRPGSYVSQEEILGTYASGTNFTFEFIMKDGELSLRRRGRNDIRLQREAANIFRQANDTAFKQEFKKNGKGEMTVTAYYTTHAPYTLERPSADCSGFDFSSLNGRYVNEETGVEIVIDHKQDKLYNVRMRNDNSPSEASLLVPGKLLFAGYAITIEKSSGATTLWLDGDRIKRVRFRPF